jgi:hypothetical protein
VGIIDRDGGVKEEGFEEIKMLFLNKDAGHQVALQPYPGLLKLTKESGHWCRYFTVPLQDYYQ